MAFKEKRTQVMADMNARYGDGVGKRVFKGAKAIHMNPKKRRAKRQDRKSRGKY